MFGTPLHQTTISHEQARAAARRLIRGAWRRDGEQLASDDRPRFSIPCRPGDDDDVVLMTYIAQQVALGEQHGR